MSFKAKAPEEDPETKAKRERAEAQAEARRTDELQDDLSAQTRELLRRFGARARAAGQPSFGFGGLSGLFGGAFGGGSSGSSGSGSSGSGGGGFTSPGPGVSFR